MISAERKDILKQFRDFAGGPLIGTVISMFTVPVTTRLVSPVEFGKSSLFTLAQTIFVFVGLLGLDQAFVRYFNVKEYARKTLLYNAMLPSFACCVVLIACVVIFQRDLSLWLFGQYEPLIMWLFCLFLPSLLFQRFGGLIIRMELRGKLYSVINIASQIIHFVFLLLFLLFYEHSFRSIIYAAMVSTFANTVIVMVITRESWTIDISCYDKKLLSTLLRFGLPLVPTTMLSWLLNSFDKVGLKEWSTYEELGVYAAALKIVALLGILQTIFSTAWIPIAFKWNETGEPQRKFEKISVAVTVVMSTAFAGVVVSRDVILLFLGAEYRNTVVVFIFLLFMPVLYTISETTGLGINFSGKTRYNIYISVVSVIVNVVGNFALIPVYGAKGAAISSCVSYVFFFLLRTFIARRLWFKFHLAGYFANLALLLLLTLIVAVDLKRFFEAVVLVLIILLNTILLIKYNIIIIHKTITRNAQ